MPREFGTPEDGVFRPLITVTLGIGVPPKTQDVLMLLDSGADFTMLPPDLAVGISELPLKKLGVDAGRVYGIGGSVRIREVTIEITYNSVTYSTAARVGATPIPLLGRDFMRLFRVSFHWDRDRPEFFIDPFHN